MNPECEAAGAFWLAGRRVAAIFSRTGGRRVGGLLPEAVCCRRRFAAGGGLLRSGGFRASVKQHGCGTVTGRAILARSPSHPARSARRLVIEATFTV